MVDNKINDLYLLLIIIFGQTGKLEQINKDCILGLKCDGVQLL